jgi:hypothetical protein
MMTTGTATAGRAAYTDFVRAAVGLPSLWENLRFNGRGWVRWRLGSLSESYSAPAIRHKYDVVAKHGDETRPG